MPRPCKRRRICALPGFIRFGAMDVPARGKHLIHMTVDEYEAIRLIDLERLTQEACARRMGVARATVQAIYNRARVKLALCLVEGDELSIGGGDYEICAGPTPGCGCSRCQNHRIQIKQGDDKG